MIAQVIAGAVQGVTSAITGVFEKADEQFTNRVAISARSREGSNAFTRNLPLIAGIILAAVIVAAILLMKNKNGGNIH